MFIVSIVGKLTLLFSSALFAVACHVNFYVSHVKALFPGYILFHLLAKRALELYDFTAAKAYKVVVLSRRLYFIVVVSLAKV